VTNDPNAGKDESLEPKAGNKVRGVVDGDVVGVHTRLPKRTTSRIELRERGCWQSRDLCVYRYSKQRRPIKYRERGKRER